MSEQQDWSIEGVLTTARQKHDGFKANFFIALLIYVGISVAIELLRASVFPEIDERTYQGIFTEIAITILIAPLSIGLGLFGVRRAVGKETPVSTLWEPYATALPLMVMMGLATALIIAGLVLFILPGIYLAVAYSFAAFLITEKGMGVWQALEASREAITEYWWRYFGLMLMSALLMLLGALPALIGLIWVLPILVIANGEVFAHTFNDGEQSDS
jgi:uncharacterized membrane protein